MKNTNRIQATTTPEAALLAEARAADAELRALVAQQQELRKQVRALRGDFGGELTRMLAEATRAMERLDARMDDIRDDPATARALFRTLITSAWLLHRSTAFELEAEDHGWVESLMESIADADAIAREHDRLARSADPARSTRRATVSGPPR